MIDWLIQEIFRKNFGYSKKWKAFPSVKRTIQISGILFPVSIAVASINKRYNSYGCIYKILKVTIDYYYIKVGHKDPNIKLWLK